MTRVEVARECELAGRKLRALAAGDFSVHTVEADGSLTLVRRARGGGCVPRVGRGSPEQRKALPTVINEAADPDFKEALTQHEDETREHIENVEQAFALLGEKPKAAKCPGIKGILKEHDDFVSDETPVGEVLELFLLGAALRTEHYEIAAYTALISLATGLGENDVAALFRKNLAEEKRMASASERLGKARAAAERG